MSKYKNHKKKSKAILLALAKWMEESEFDYEIQDLAKALNEVKIYYKNYLDMKELPRYQPDIKHEFYK